MVPRRSAAAVLRDALGRGEHDGSAAALAARPTPPSLEDEILGDDGRSRGFIGEELGGDGLLALDKGALPYLLAKATESKTASPLAASPHLPADRWGDEAWGVEARRATTVFRTIDADTVAALRTEARARGTTIGSALAAAAARAFAALGGGGDAVKVLQSLDMRRFAARDVPRDELACHAGSFDLVLAPRDFWEAAADASSQLAAFEARGRAATAHLRGAYLRGAGVVLHVPSKVDRVPARRPTASGRSPSASSTGPSRAPAASFPSGRRARSPIDCTRVSFLDE